VRPTRPAAPASEPNGITRWPPWRSISAPIVGDSRPAISKPAEKPPIAKVNEKPRSAAISGSIRTGV